MRRSLRRRRQARRLRHRRPSDCGAWATSCDGEPRLRVPKERTVGEYRPWRWSHLRQEQSLGRGARGSANPRPASCRARWFPHSCLIRAGHLPRFRSPRDLPHLRQAQHHRRHLVRHWLPTCPARRAPHLQTQSRPALSGLSSPKPQRKLLHLGPHPLGPLSHHSYIPQCNVGSTMYPKMGPYRAGVQFEIRFNVSVNPTHSRGSKKPPERK